ncbi:MAG: response regulator, partial [Sciscionella sp.]
LRTLHELGGVSSAEGETAAGACRSAIEVLRQSRVDVPFALAYLFEANARCGRLLASYGVRTGTSIAPEALPTHDNGGPAWSVARSGRGELVAGLRRNHADDFEPGPIGAAVPDSAMVLPLTRSGQTSLAGLLVLAVSPYRAFDDEYRVFFDLVAGQVSTALTDAIAYQMERRRAEQLAELDVARSRFFQNISHEFQTPLTLLLEPLRALLAEPELRLSGGHRAAMEAARRAALRLQRLVDTLLDTARADANRLHTQQEPTDLALLTAELASMFRSVAEHAGLRLVVHTPTLPEPVPVDREMWAKIVLNLLSNAVKFTRAGHVSVALRARDEYAELSVSDSGIGIPATELPRVFDRFHQLPGTNARSREGSGIGLSLVSELVSALHGEVLVVSILGEGSTFTVRLPRGGAPADVAPRPLEPVENTATPFVEEALRWVPAGGAEEPRQRVDGPRPTARVLLVEDNADMREYLTRLLREQSWTVDTAGDGDTALESAMAQPPDLVLSDIMLPGLDGIGLLQAMRGDQSLSRVPVILLTARAGSEATVEGLRSGADDYVAKPFEPNELLARIRVHLELSLLRELLISSGEQRVANLEAALSTRGVISQAVGILMAQRHCDAEIAFELLNKASQNSNVKVHDVASRIVARASRPD